MGLIRKGLVVEKEKYLGCFQEVQSFVKWQSLNTIHQDYHWRRTAGFWILFIFISVFNFDWIEKKHEHPEQDVCHLLER